MYVGVLPRKLAVVKPHPTHTRLHQSSYALVETPTQANEETNITIDIGRSDTQARTNTFLAHMNIHTHAHAQTHTHTGWGLKPVVLCVVVVAAAAVVVLSKQSKNTLATSHTREEEKRTTQRQDKKERRSKAELRQRSSGRRGHETKTRGDLRKKVVPTFRHCQCEVFKKN